MHKLNTLPDSFVLNNTKNRFTHKWPWFFHDKSFNNSLYSSLSIFLGSLLNNFLTVKRTFNQIHCISQIRTFSPDNSLSLTTLWTHLLKDHWTFFLTAWSLNISPGSSSNDFPTVNWIFNLNNLFLTEQNTPPWQFIEQFFWHIIEHFYYWTLSLTAY